MNVFKPEHPAGFPTRTLTFRVQGATGWDALVLALPIPRWLKARWVAWKILRHYGSPPMVEARLHCFDLADGSKWTILDASGRVERYG
jgi:hypothetical protein